MVGKVLLDTNIVVGIFHGETAHADVGSLSSSEVFVPAIVIGELCFGAEKSTRITENLRRIELFTAKNRVIDADGDTGLFYGRIKYQLQKKGRPIPDNDIWIAAVAVQHGLSLVSRDHHFEHIDGLLLIPW